jgi:hypothetical protein
MSFSIRLSILIAFAVGSMFVLISFTASSQQEEKLDRVVKMKSFSNMPVKITTVKAKSGTVKIGNKFKMMMTGLNTSNLISRTFQTNPLTISAP